MPNFNQNLKSMNKRHELSGLLRSAQAGGSQKSGIYFTVAALREADNRQRRQNCGDAWSAKIKL
jgi:hypothetical protein